MKELFKKTTMIFIKNVNSVFVKVLYLFVFSSVYNVGVTEYTQKGEVITTVILAGIVYGAMAVIATHFVARLVEDLFKWKETKGNDRNFKQSTNSGVMSTHEHNETKL